MKVSRGKKCRSGVCAICINELSCDTLRYDNFHNHGVTLCNSCVLRVWRDFKGVCCYCTVKLTAGCSICHTTFPLTELFPDWHGHPGHNVCIICLQTQYARSKCFECMLHVGESVIIPYRNHPMIEEARYQTIFRHVNAISQLTRQLAAILNNYGYPHTAQRVVLDLSWLLYRRNVVVEFDR